MNDTQAQRDRDAILARVSELKMDSAEDEISGGLARHTGRSKVAKLRAEEPSAEI